MKTSVIWSDGAFPSDTSPLAGPLATCIPQAAEMGYDALTLSAKDKGEIDVAWLKSALAAYRMCVSGIATGGIFGGMKATLGADDEDKRALAVSQMCGLAQVCHELDGARLIVAAVRGRTSVAASREKYESNLRRSLEEILATCEPLGVTVLMEAMEESAFDFGNRIPETAEFVQSVGSLFLKLQIDTYHIHGNAEEDSYVESIKEYAHLIAQADISDHGCMAPDGKHFDFKPYLDALAEVGYDDWFVFEYRPAPPENAAKLGLDYIKSLL